MRSIDGIARRPGSEAVLPHLRPAVMPVPAAGTRPLNNPQTPAGQAAQPVPIRRTFAAPSSALPRRRWWHNLIPPVCVFGGLIAGFFMQSLAFGLVVVSVYILVAWIRRVPSRITFVLAFLALVTVVVLLTVRPNVQLASNFSTYTFMLLAGGAVSVALESRAAPKHKRGKIGR
jgi:hypothetical protein